MSFGSIAGHERTLTILRRAVLTDRIPHAYLFAGPPSVGKTLVAFELAKALNCLNITDPTRIEDIEPCDQCANCTAISHENHPDFMVIRPTQVLERKKSDDDGETPEETHKKQTESIDIEDAMIRIEDIRDRLLPHASLTRASARHKVYIICRPETMNDVAANALLKTLEEPPPSTTFILCCANTGPLLQTIISRCQVAKFHPVPPLVATEFLASRHPEIEHERILSVVALSGGRIGWANRLLQWPDVLRIRDDILDLCVRLHGSDWVECLRGGELLVDAAERWWRATNDEETAEKALKAIRDRILRTTMHDVLDIASTWFRDILLLSTSGQAEGIVNVDRREQLLSLAPGYDPQRCMNACRHFQQMHAQLRQNSNLRLSAENLALRLIVT